MALLQMESVDEAIRALVVILKRDLFRISISSNFYLKTLLRVLLILFFKFANLPACFKELHNFKLSDTNHLRVSFSRTQISASQTR